MDLLHWNITNEELDNLKGIYKNLYMRIQQGDASKQQKDIMLNKLIDELFMERLKKLMYEDINISEGKSIAFYAELKDLFKEWNIEFKKD